MAEYGRRTTFTLSIPLSEWKKSKDEKAGQKSENKKREKHIKNIKEYVCALLNSDGGKLILSVHPDKDLSAGDITEHGLRSADIIRPVEQALRPLIGIDCLISHLTVCSEKRSEIILKIKALNVLCTLNYHMFLPSNTEVLPINERSVVIDKMDVNRIVDVTEFEDSVPPDRFILNSVLDVNESKTLQFKCLKAETSARGDLAKRIIKNKFTSYVSAFANNVGGRLFIGIDDKTGRVVGECIAESEQKGCEKKLKQQIDKMLWPGHCTPPEKGKQWDISFHAVMNSDGSPAKGDKDESKKLWIVVVTVPSCTGGVFVSEPESYHVVNRETKSSTVEKKIEAIPFEDWKNRLLCPDGDRVIPRSLSRLDWSSRQLRRKCDSLDGNLLRLINNGKWSDFIREAGRRQPKAGDPNGIEVELVLLSKWYVYHYRKGEDGDFDAATKQLTLFNEKLTKAKNSSIFEVRGKLILSALQRTQGDHLGSYQTARDCLSAVEILSPCILTAEFYVHFATVLTIIQGNAKLREKLKADLSQGSFQDEALVYYRKALQHLQKIDYVPLSKADMQQKTEINMAILLLGCSLSGDVVEHFVNKEAIDTAATCLKNVSDSRLKDGNSLNSFRSCHYKFATSSLYYRRSQLEKKINKRILLLDSAIQGAEEVEFLANRHKFYELSNYASKHANVYRVELEQLQADADVFEEP